MIAPLRQRHRWMLLGLTLSVPLAFGAALWQRPAIGPGAPAEFPPSPSLLGPSVSTIPGDAFELRLGPPATAGTAREFELIPQSLELGPDLLVYLVQGSSEPEGSQLPDSAYLVGTASPLRPTRMSIPSETTPPPTQLWVYGLAHQSVAASFGLTGPAPGSMTGQPTNAGGE